MEARPVLSLLARVLADHGLEAILIGNAAAALQGAPVTTVDVDFLFRRTTRNVTKLKAVAKTLGATLMRPYYPASDLFRLERDEDGLQVDFMGTIHGVRSFESLRSRAFRWEIAGVALWVADLADVVRSKRAAGRPRDRAVLDILERTLHEREAAKPKAKTRSPAAGK
jgi:predicted nucleotidyltransferase